MFSERNVAQSRSDLAPIGTQLAERKPLNWSSMAGENGVEPGSRGETQGALFLHAFSGLVFRWLPAQRPDRGRARRIW